MFEQGLVGNTGFGASRTSVDKGIWEVLALHVIPDTGLPLVGKVWTEGAEMFPRLILHHILQQLLGGTQVHISGYIWE